VSLTVVCQSCTWQDDNTWVFCVCQGKKAKAAARPKTYALHEDEDGWEGIQEAQNAAATRALFQVCNAAAAAAAALSYSLLFLVNVIVQLHVVVRHCTGGIHANFAA